MIKLPDRTGMVNMTDTLFDKLFSSGVFSKDSLIYTNAVVSRQIESFGLLALGDDGKEILCPSRAILGFGAIEYSLGQRIYCAVRHNKALSYLTMPEMTYGEVAGFIRKTILYSQTMSYRRKCKALAMLAFLVKMTNGELNFKAEIKEFKRIVRSYFLMEDGNVVLD